MVRAIVAIRQHTEVIENFLSKITGICSPLTLLSGEGSLGDNVPTPAWRR